MSGVKEIVEHIDQLLDKLSPYASLIGAEKIAGMINSAVDIAELLLDNVNSVQEVLSSSDLDAIRVKLEEIKTKNDALNIRVENS